MPFTDQRVAVFLRAKGIHTIVDVNGFQVVKTDLYGVKHLGSLMVLVTQEDNADSGRKQISCPTAWNLLNGAEDSLGYPLILRNKGGPSGSGSLLTEKGSALLAASEGFEIAARKNLEKLYNDYFRDII